VAGTARALRPERVTVPPAAWWLIATTVNVTASAFNAGLADVAAPLAIGWFRMVVATLALAIITRGSFRHVPFRWSLVLLGALIAIMNESFYVAVTEIDFSAVNTIILIGPIGLAAVLSRTPAQLAAAGLAGVGVVLIAAPWSASFAALGVGLSVVGAGAWVAYIFVGQRLTRAFPSAAIAVLGLFWSAVIQTPFALAVGGFPFLDRAAVITIVIAAVLGGALPYLAEMHVLQRMTARAYGILQGMYPAIGITVGVVVLDQQPAVLALAGMAMVSVAAVLASTRTPGRL
jgi:inner membrane transporter RhtA